MERWFLINKQPNNKVNPEELGITPLQYKILVHRGVETRKEIREFMNPSLESLHSPVLMKDMIKSGNIILKKIKNQEPIRIIGDYDVDGVMSTVILYTGLKKLGAKADYRIPHRVKEGYGISDEMVESAVEDDIGLIITCDNGIGAFSQGEKAKEEGIDLIVTDHHDPVTSDGEEVLPEASGIINPKRKGDSYPYKQICGAVVAFKLMTYLYTVSGMEEQIFDDFLPYITMATVCDVMPLLDENRTIVSFGLPAIQNSDNYGFQALKKVAGIENNIIGVYHLGFILGPMINSAGRLSHAGKAVELFLTEDQSKANKIAEELYRLNRERQDLTEQGVVRFESQISDFDKLPKALILYEPGLHESIVGIIAGRIKEKYYRPTIIFTDGKKGLKGSGRSIEEYNMAEEIGKYRDKLLSFGGHPMAAGMTVSKENFSDFRDSVIRDFPLSEEELQKSLRLDDSLHFSEINMNLIQSLYQLEPFGTGNSKPLFGTIGCEILNMRLLGKNKNVLKLQLREDGVILEGILFHSVREFFDRINAGYPGSVVKDAFYGRPNPVRTDIVYTPELNEYRGKTSIQLVLKSVRF